MRAAPPEEPCLPRPDDCLAPPVLAQALKVRGCEASGLRIAAKASVARGEVSRAMGTSSKGEDDLEPDLPGLTTASLKELDKISHELLES